jgi:flagellar basal body-associated protein FliL
MVLESQILMDIREDTPESVLDEIVKQLNMFVRSKSWDKWITDVYYEYF